MLQPTGGRFGWLKHPENGGCEAGVWEEGKAPARAKGEAGQISSDLFLLCWEKNPNDGDFARESRPHCALHHCRFGNDMDFFNNLPRIKGRIYMIL